MTTKVYLSHHDAPLDPADATVSVFDRGFLYGDSIYETMRTANGVPLELQRHLRRLEHSGAGIGMPLPRTPAQFEDIIRRTHAATGNGESYVRVMVTRGEGPIALDPRKSSEPTVVVIAKPLELPSVELYQRGISVVIVDVEKAGGGIDPGIKTGNYLSNIIALRQAIERGGDDAILCNAAGEVAEGATSNLFLIERGVLRTPNLGTGILAGITRGLVCELAAKLGLPAAEERVTPDELRSADEVFLTSSVRGIMPVTAVDGQQIGDGEVGEATKKLRASYEAYIDGYAAS